MLTIYNINSISFLIFLIFDFLLVLIILLVIQSSKFFKKQRSNKATECFLLILFRAKPLVYPFTLNKFTTKKKNTYVVPFFCTFYLLPRKETTLYPEKIPSFTPYASCFLYSHENPEKDPTLCHNLTIKKGCIFLLVTSTGYSLPSFTPKRYTPKDTTGYQQKDKTFLYPFFVRKGFYRYPKNYYKKIGYQR